MNKQAHRSILFMLLGMMLLGMGILLTPSAAEAQMNSASTTSSERSRFSIEGGLGFTANPTSFLLEFEGAYEVGNGFAFGPAIQLGLDDDFSLVSPTVFGRYGFDLSGLSQKEFRRLTPYVQVGTGFTYIDGDNADDDIGFLINTGFGADYAITNNVSIGSRMLFNFLPSEVIDQSFYYSWQMASVRYRF